MQNGTVMWTLSVLKILWCFDLMTVLPSLWLCRRPRVSNLLVEHASEDGGRIRTVGEWLDSIKMGRYSELFMEGGYSSLDTVAQMTSE